jgi:hypothetical protein
MKAFARFFAQLAFYAIAVGLLVYAASRSLHFIQSSLDEENQILGYFALLATSGGMIAWLLVFLHKADGVIQKGIALLMIVVDFLGEAALFTMDTLQQAGINGVVTQLAPSEVRLVLIGMSVLIAANILATIAYHLGNMDVIRQIAEGAQKDILFFKSLSEIEKQSDELARDMAPTIAGEWKDQFSQNYGSASKLGLTGSGKSAGANVTLPKLRMPHISFAPWRTLSKSSANVSESSPVYFPIMAQQQLQVGNKNIQVGDRIEATAGTSGNYILRIPGDLKPIGEVSATDFAGLLTGKELPVPVDEKPTLSPNGHHPPSP